MENFNNIPKTGTFGNSVDVMNQNFALAKEAIEKLGFKESACVGFYTTSSALNSDIPNPTDGNWALVGSSTPFAVYVADDGAWVNSGVDYELEINMSVPVVNNLTDGGTTSALSAEQGKVVNTRVSVLEAPFSEQHITPIEWVNDIDSQIDELASTNLAQDNRLTALETLTGDETKGNDALDARLSEVESIDGGLLPDIEMLPTETGYWQKSTGSNPHTPHASSGWHTPLTIIPKGYDTIILNSYSDFAVSYSSSAQTDGYETLPVILFYDSNQQEMVSDAVLKGFHRGYYGRYYETSIPDGAAYVSCNVLYRQIPTEVNRVYAAKIVSSQSNLDKLQLGRSMAHTRRITTAETSRWGYFDLGNVNIGDTLPNLGAEPRVMALQHRLYDIQRVERGDTIKVAVKCAYYGWAFFDEELKLVEKSEQSINTTSTPVVLEAVKAGYILVQHNTGDNLEPADGVYCRINDYTELDPNSVITIDDLDDYATKDIWEIVRGKETKGKYLSSTLEISNGVYHMFTYPVQAGEKYRLHVTVGLGMSSASPSSLNVYRILDTTDIATPISQMPTPRTSLLTGEQLNQINEDEVFDITIPTGGKLLVYQGYYRDDKAWNLQKDYPCTGLSLEKLSDIKTCPPRKTLKILAVGNSFTCDELGYLPYVLKNIHPEIELHLRILYKGGASLSEYWAGRSSATVGGEPLVAYDWRTSAGRWSDYYDSNNATWSQGVATTLENSIKSEDWDIITFQQESKYIEWSYIESPLNNLVNWLRFELGYVNKIGWLMVHSYSDSVLTKSAASFIGTSLEGITTSDGMWELNVESTMAVANSGLVDFIIPSGTAIQNARHNGKLHITGTGDTSKDIVNMFCVGKPSDNTGGDIHLEEGIAPLCGSLSGVAAIYHSCVGARVDLSPAWIVPQSSPSGTTMAWCKANRGLNMNDEKQAEAVRCAMDAILSPYTISSNNNN